MTSMVSLEPSWSLVVEDAYLHAWLLKTPTTSLS
jgi:hypothetical protein